MFEISSLKNTEIDKIPFLFCSKCKNFLDKNSKKCNNVNCSKIFCSKCAKDQICPNCKIDTLKKYEQKVINLDNILFYCSKSKECKGQYTYEEKIKNHSHKNIEIIKCNKCDKNLNQTINCIKCSKCNSFFCYKRLNYNPFFNTKEKNLTQNCGIKCIKCFQNFCSLCEKNNNTNICSQCLQKNPKEENNINKCCICLSNKTSQICSLCNNNICFSCSNICQNNSCKNIICINCSFFCNICKKIICSKCTLKCSSCDPGKSLISCLKCNSNTIIKCSVKSCKNKLCLNCLKFCNFCKEINCSIHSLSCANCSETICPFHWHMCKKCSQNKDDFSMNKLCLKNCTKKCNFCTNEVNLFCQEENHKNNFVKKYSCGHYICNSCIKKCDICKETVIACSECEKDLNYIQCRICDKLLCNYCSKKCSSCGENYCDESHKCFLCDKIINNEICLNCDFLERNKCTTCGKKLPQCQKCSKIIICSKKCFLKNIKKRIIVNKNFNRSKTSQSIKSNITNNVINNVVNLFQNNEDEKNSLNLNYNSQGNKIIIETEKGEHICFMYYCKEHLIEKSENKTKDEKKNNFRKEDQNEVNKYNRITDKENIKCSSCFIF